MPNKSKSVLFLYKAPSRETTLLKETDDPLLQDLISERTQAYRANLERIKSDPNLIPYVWEGFLPDDALHFHPQDFAIYWPNYGLALPPELRYTQIPRTIRRILAAFPEAKTPPYFTFEGGTIVKGGNLLFYPIHTATDLMSDELPYEEINQRYQETAQVSGYIPIGLDIPQSLKDAPLFKDIHLHIDRMISPPFKLKDGTYLVFAIAPLVKQIKEKALSKGTNVTVVSIPVELLYIAELLNLPVLTHADTTTSGKSDVIFLNPLLARLFLSASTRSPEEAMATFISRFNLGPILEEVNQIVQVYKNAWQTRLPDKSDYIQLDTHLAHLWAKHRNYLERITGPLSAQELEQLRKLVVSNLDTTQQLEVLPYALPTLTRISAGDKCNTNFWPISPGKT